MKACYLFFVCAGFLLSTAYAQVDHSAWDALLKKHVKEGRVDYKGFRSDSVALWAYVDDLSQNPPQEDWSRAAQLAYWINAYNAFTVKLIVDHYPLESIQDLHPTVKIPGISTIWKKEFFTIGGEPFSFHKIEHKILRKQFGEARIHFAINCASFSCPDLLNGAFVPERLEEQLEARAKAFVNDSTKNIIRAERIQISRIFSWFKGDFTKNGSLIAFLNRYSDTAIDKDAKITYLEYNWSLNE